MRDKWLTTLGLLFTVSACSNEPGPLIPTSVGPSGGGTSPNVAPEMGGAINSPGGPSSFGGAGGFSSDPAGSGGSATEPSNGGSSGSTTQASGGTPNDGGSGTVRSDGSAPERQRLAVTADFLNQTLSVVDLNGMVDGSKREDVLVRTVDLSKYTPGPLDLAITPDGKTAIAAISGGWLGAFTTVPAGNGTLVFVDIATGTVSGELYTGASPMGIAITKDGKRAFVGQYAESYFAVVDIAHRTFTQVPTANQYNEEIALDDSGSVGILSYGPAGNCFTFSVDDPTGTQGATVGLSGDAGGVAFFPGTKIGYVIQAPTPLTAEIGGHDLIDVSNPKSPVDSDDVRIPGSPTWYPVTPVPSRHSVAYPSTLNGQLSIVEMGLSGAAAMQVQSVTVGAAQTLAYGVTADENGVVYATVGTEHYVAVVDLVTATSFMVPWDVTNTGPNDIAIVP